VRSAISQLLCAAVLLLGLNTHVVAQTGADPNTMNQARVLRATGEYDGA
jgi:hypothetical protein